MPPTILQVSETEDVEALLARAARVVLSGGVVAVPTESFYGLAVNAMDGQALEQLLKVKKIRDQHPILTLIPSKEVLERYVLRVSHVAEVLMQAFWPGGLTLVLEASDELPSLLTAGTRKIGVRLSSHPLATGLARAAGMPITGTSANVTGEPPCLRAEEVLEFLGGGVDLILDGGGTEGGKGSTVLDVTVHPPLILREGIIGRDQLLPFIPGL